MFITSQELKNKEACSKDLAVFEKTWPSGTNVSAETIKQAHNLGLNLAWFATRFLTKQQLYKYRLIISPAPMGKYNEFAKEALIQILINKIELPELPELLSPTEVKYKRETYFPSDWIMPGEFSFCPRCGYSISKGPPSNKVCKSCSTPKYTYLKGENLCSPFNKIYRFILKCFNISIFATTWSGIDKENKVILNERIALASKRKNKGLKPLFWRSPMDPFIDSL